MKFKIIIVAFLTVTMFWSCKSETSNSISSNEFIETTSNDFPYFVEQFADLKILRYQIPGWNDLSLKEQKLVYYLTQAGLSGRDIMWNMNYRHNLKIRTALEQVYTSFSGDKNTDNWNSFEVYLKRVWFSNGIHHHYSNAKIKPAFSEDYLKSLLDETSTTLEGEAFEIIFNDRDAKKVDKSKNVDNVLAAAVNFYGADVTTEDVETFYGQFESSDRPLSYGLNSMLVKENGVLKERVYKSGGLYGEAIVEIVKWLKLAQGVAENQAQ